MLKSGVVLFLYLMTVSFTKRYNSPEDIISILSERGLAINDKARACRYLQTIGYYRLSAYFYPFLLQPKEEHRFKPGCEFQNALDLYRFDKKLRLFLFNEIEKIEIAFRSVLANVAAKESGNIFWMTDASMFSNEEKFRRTMTLVDKEMKSSKEDFILHFKGKYNEAYPPAWMLVEILPLGVVTRIYENIKSNQLKKSISGYFDLPVPVFISWLTVITLTRNSCCHHLRIWNRLYAVNPMIAKKMKRPWISKDISPRKTFYEICIIKWFIDIISPQNDMKGHLQQLLADFPMVDIRAMGFPDRWDMEPLWTD